MRIRVNSTNKNLLIGSIVTTLISLLVFCCIFFNFDFNDENYIVISVLSILVLIMLFGITFIFVCILHKKYYLEIDEVSVMYIDGSKTLWKLNWSDITSISYVDVYSDDSSKPIYNELVFKTNNDKEFNCICNEDIFDAVNKIHKIENLV